MATNYNKDHHNATPLYNGNISALTTDYHSTDVTPLVKFFRYDKLNRIKTMQTNSATWNSQCSPSNKYSTQYLYDFNGNLDMLVRKSFNSNDLHNINYQYVFNKNRLDSITTYAGLTSSRYCYDAIGNLIQDTGEELDISWNAAGKVDTIWKDGNVLSTFRYSATGQRQMKKTGGIADYYIHDASGNVMCIYRETPNTFKAMERPIYGSKRLGELKQEVNLTTPTNPSIPPFTIGMRQYELTDHLGNVMTTLLDRRQPYSSGDDTYKPYIISTTDYYPFGYPIPNRSTNTGGYRYFFNGQEGDNEVFGEVANFGYEFRQYDSRLGRWWSVDPKWSEYPSMSPYMFCNGSPVIMMDPKGEDPIYKKKFFGGVKKIGDDGKCGTGSYLVKGKKAREVKAVTKSGEFYTGNLSIGKDVIHIPTGEIQRGVQETVESTRKSGDSPDTRIEYGGHSLYGDVKARLWDPGSPTQVSKLEDGTIIKMRTVTPFKINGEKRKIGGPPQMVEFVWHVHTYSSKPSYIDFDEIAYWIRGGFSGNAFVVSENDNSVSFYNLTKVIMRISYTDFIRMGNQEDIP